MDSLDNMFGINEQHKLFENTNDMILGMDKKSSENPETKGIFLYKIGKKISIPCEYRTSCEECTVDFSVFDNLNSATIVQARNNVCQLNISVLTVSLVRIVPPVISITSKLVEVCFL